jgi:hydroxymethylpyrimidine/phosphomethylpyrimidine kinase
MSGEDERNDRSCRPRVRVALTIAGFDPSNGAGVTADLQVFAAHGLFGVSAITSLTVQSTIGVAGVQVVDSGFLGKTLETLELDMPVDGVKVGMLGAEEVVGTVAKFLKNKGDRVPVVVDPVVRASSGQELLEVAALERLREELLPLAGWITPNWMELGVLTGREIRSLAEVHEAIEVLGRRYPGLSVVATGGEAENVVDILWSARGGFVEFAGERVRTSSTHGTGCAFSSALLARLVLGDSAEEAVAGAKRYVAEALRWAPGLGHGRGPLGLLWPLRR